MDLCSALMFSQKSFSNAWQLKNRNKNRSSITIVAALKASDVARD